MRSMLRVIVASCFVVSCADSDRLYRTPSSAMTPTLLIGEHFLADESAYASAEPQLGDVVVFPIARGPNGSIYPVDRRPNLPTDVFFKRIVGVPGDTIEYRGGKLIRNGTEVAETATGRSLVTCNGSTAEIYVVRMGESEFEIAHDPIQAEIESLPLSVPEGRFFVVGDYRSWSNDSRIWGTIPRESIQAKATVRAGGAAPDGCEPLSDRDGTKIR